MRKHDNKTAHAPATVQSVVAQELTKRDIQAILALRSRVWPTNTKSLQWYLAKHDVRPERVASLIWEHNRLIAHAETFAREIKSDRQSCKVRCLSTVFVAPDRQGKGLGRILVQHIFDEVRKSDCTALLWQTTVPEFYKKLGAVLVHNCFINTCSQTPETSPWEDQPMIYPPDAAWPTGTIDLNGEAF